MTNPEIRVTSSAAKRLRKMSTRQKEAVVKVLEEAVSGLALGKMTTGERLIEDSSYIALETGEGVALVRPMDTAERKRFDVRTPKGYVVADILPTKLPE
ncbi:hypothetical protein [Streptomyces erythrochromogenes]|uniref:hypothetical protein n=1 Tax=Streptomyces erythrochromogenes TaxID=285574 RepID=UPI003830CC0C